MIMKRNINWRRAILLIVGVVLATAIGFGIFHPFSYDVPFAESDVSSVTVYYTYDLMQKKTADMQSEISLLYTSLGDISPRGSYKQTPDGGQSFILVFHLNDGSDWICTYFQTADDGRGYFADKNEQLKVVNLNLKQLWNQIRQQSTSITAAEVDALYMRFLERHK